jgi:hypothetical protein
MTPQELVARLAKPGEQLAVGIVLLSPSMYADVANLAAKWGCTEVDLVEAYLARLPAETAFAKLTPQTVLETIDGIASTAQTTVNVLALGLEVLVARLRAAEREAVWRLLRETMRKRPTRLLLAFPDDAAHLLPVDEAAAWRDMGRVAEVGGTATGDY